MSDNPEKNMDERLASLERGLGQPGLAERREDGMPIGNARMGTLVWTTPDRLRFEINRADVNPQALDAERLSRASEALHLALLQSNPPAPDEDPVTQVFPAWPKEWNAR